MFPVLDDPGPTKVPLSLARYTTSRRDVRDYRFLCKLTWLALVHAGSIVAKTNIEAPPWIADFRFSTALDAIFLCRFSGLYGLISPLEVFLVSFVFRSGWGWISHIRPAYPPV